MWLYLPSIIFQSLLPNYNIRTHPLSTLFKKLKHAKVIWVSGVNFFLQYCLIYYDTFKNGKYLIINKYKNRVRSKVEKITINEEKCEINPYIMYK